LLYEDPQGSMFAAAQKLKFDHIQAVRGGHPIRSLADFLDTQ
jgi:hypothetical protein